MKEKTRINTPSMSIFFARSLFSVIFFDDVFKRRNPIIKNTNIEVTREKNNNIPDKGTISELNIKS